MYAHIRGEVIEIAAERAVIEACGVGYELLCSSKTLSALKKGKEAMLFAHLHTAEGLQALYGFIDEAELYSLAERLKPKMEEIIYLIPANFYRL